MHPPLGLKESKGLVMNCVFMRVMIDARKENGSFRIPCHAEASGKPDVF